MSTERERILTMLSEGEIEVEEANELLRSLGEGEKKNAATTKKVSSLKIVVNEKKGEKINISLPIGLAKGLLKFIPASAKERLSEEDIDLDSLFNSIESLEGPSDIVNIDDGEDKIIIRLE